MVEDGEWSPNWWDDDIAKQATWICIRLFFWWWVAGLTLIILEVALWTIAEEGYLCITGPCNGGY